MSKENLAEQAKEMQGLFKPSPIALQAFQDNATRFWSAQEQMLDAMQGFAEGWLQRRHEGTRAAAEVAHRMCRAENPIDLLKEHQEWMNGAIQRLMADGVACQKEWALITGLAVQPLNGSGKEDAEEAPPRASPHAAERPKVA
jgi:hypothetical protein